MPNLLETDLLVGIAQVSLALLGFTALLSSLEGTTEEDINSFNSVRIMSTIELSLLALVFSLLPHVLAGFGFSGALLWRVLSGLLGFWLGITWFRIAVWHRRIRGGALNIDTPIAYTLALATSAVVTVGLSATAMGFLEGNEMGAYLAGVVWLVFNAAFAFWASFKQQWRTQSGTKGA